MTCWSRPWARRTSALNLGSPPAPILMVGLQGSGKTTTSAKLGLLLQTKEKKRVLMASLDVNRPAAMEQLRVLGEQAGVATLPVVAGQDPLAIARRAMASAKVGGYDVLILDTAGRQSIDEQLMSEVAAIKAATNPHETLLVADSLTGQDAVNIAKNFNDRVQLSGIILTRVDGDARGGAALSMRARHRRADQVPGRGRKARRAGSLPSRPRRRPHSRHGRCGVAGRKGRGDARQGGSGEDRRQDEEGSVRHERPRWRSWAR